MPSKKTKKEETNGYRVFGEIPRKRSSKSGNLQKNQVLCATTISFRVIIYKQPVGTYSIKLSNT